MRHPHTRHAALVVATLRLLQHGASYVILDFDELMQINEQNTADVTGTNSP
jgi:hypothetical protein